MLRLREFRSRDCSTTLVSIRMSAITLGQGVEQEEHLQGELHTEELQGEVQGEVAQGETRLVGQGEDQERAVPAGGEWADSPGKIKDNMAKEEML